MNQNTKKFGQIALITITFSIIWTGLSRLFNIFSFATYDTFFKNTSTIFWHVGAPMAITFVLFFLYMRKLDRTQQIYAKQPELSTPLKVLFAIVVVGMIGFSLYNLTKNLNMIMHNWNDDSLSRILMSFCSVFFVGLTEESVFRGFALSELRRENNEVVSWILSIVLFGLWHFPNIITGAPLLQATLQTFSTMIIGTGIYMAVRLARSIWGGVGLHWLWDFALVIGH